MVIVAMLLAFCLPAFMGGIDDFRTDLATNTYVVSTGAAVANSTIQLSSPLWEGLITNASISSNITSDTPSITSYTTGSKALDFNGLAANTSRLITVEYKTAGLNGFAGVDQGVKVLPVALVLAVIFLPLIAIIFIILGR